MREWTALALGTALTCAALAGAQTLEQEGKAWLGRHTQPAGMDVTGTWQSDDWGKVVLEQVKDGREVTGTGDGWDITGVVSGRTAFLVFSGKNGMAEYSAELVADGDKALRGSYSKKLMTESSKKKPMLLAR